VNLLVIVFVDLLFFLRAPAPERGLEISLSILRADHEANLARWISRNGRISVFDVGENFFAVGLKLGDQWQVEPLVFS